MSILNFKEIPEAHKGSGFQDTFELFARDFLEFMNYKVVIDPSRGADGGKDLIVEETRTGVGGETNIKWLVSCKHKAYSGKSVILSDDNDISDRVKSNNCQGFIGFYSTLASSGISSKLESLKNDFEYQIFDFKKIEKYLITSAKGIKLAKRYFPQSIKEWIQENPEPSDIFTEEVKMNCEKCGKNLLVHQQNRVNAEEQQYQGEEGEDKNIFRTIKLLIE